MGFEDVVKKGVENSTGKKVGEETDVFKVFEFPFDLMVIVVTEKVRNFLYRSIKESSGAPTSALTFFLPIRVGKVFLSTEPECSRPRTPALAEEISQNNIELPLATKTYGTN